MSFTAISMAFAVAQQASDHALPVSPEVLCAIASRPFAFEGDTVEIEAVIFPYYAGRSVIIVPNCPAATLGIDLFKSAPSRSVAALANEAVRQMEHGAGLRIVARGTVTCGSFGEVEYCSFDPEEVLNWEIASDGTEVR